MNATIDRMVKLYADGHRIVVSTSGGKDSTCIQEICLIAARETGRLPVEMIHRDEEIIQPGTAEYLERVAARDDISFHWVIANQPIINCVDRVNPYWWVFDPLVPCETWVRQPPSYAYHIPDLNIERMTIPERFPPPAGKNLYAVIGLRTQESKARLMGLFSSGSHITKPNKYGVSNVRPIYDWTDADVWRFIQEGKFDYNRAYDTMLKMGWPKHRFRIAPPTMNRPGIETLGLAFQAWPNWATKCCRRLPGLRLAAQFGKRVVTPQRKYGESWEEVFKRECIRDAPQWIRERAEKTMTRSLSTHAAHATTPYHESVQCRQCRGTIRCWKDLAMALYNGDPFSQKCYDLPAVEPEAFRPGSGTWGGKASF